MASYNRVILMGNLSRDIELKYTQSGLAVRRRSSDRATPMVLLPTSRPSMRMGSRCQVCGEASTVSTGLP